MASVCLNMIVKNESRVIERCLEAAAPHIDYWIIVDTGSEDDTRERIERFFAQRGIPGELHQRPWKSFGHNRTEALRLAEGTADYLLLCDADMVLEVHAQDWKENLEADGYAPVQRHTDGSLQYRNLRLINARADGDRRWRYYGSTHEFLDTVVPEIARRESTGDISFLDYADGGARADKLERDLHLLNTDLARLQALESGTAAEEQPGELEQLQRLQPRTLYYLGQTLQALERHGEAISVYRKRLDLPGWKDETYYASLQIARCLVRQDRPWAEVCHAFLNAYAADPHRAESLLPLIEHYNRSKDRHLALLFADVARNLTPPEDGLFVQPWVYAYGVLDEYVVTCWHLGHYAECVASCRALLDTPKLPEERRRRTQANLRLALRALARELGAEQKKRGAEAPRV